MKTFGLFCPVLASRPHDRHRPVYTNRASSCDMGHRMPTNGFVYPLPWSGNFRPTLGDSGKVFAPEGLQDSAQGFNPWEPIPKRCALKGRQIERTSHTKAGVIVNMSHCSSLAPSERNVLIGWFPGLKPWA
jgi:hypothetical protein